MTPTVIAQLWYTAMEAEIGIAIACTDVGLLRNDLYKAKELLNDPTLDALIMVLAKEGEIWLVKKATEL